MYKDYVIPFDPPPPFDPEVGFSPKVEIITRVLNRFNKLNPVEQRLDREELIELMGLNSAKLTRQCLVFKELYGYLHTMIHAQPNYWLINVSMLSLMANSFTVRAEYEDKIKREK